MSPTKPRKLTPRQEAASADTTPKRLTELAQDPKLVRLVAANPNASADLLLELSHSEDKTVRKACTSNPNTPVEALLKLGGQFPEQLLENPVFNLLLLAHPGLFEDLPTATLNSLLKRDQVPVELIRRAWKNCLKKWDKVSSRNADQRHTLESLLINSNTPSDVLAEVFAFAEKRRWGQHDYHRMAADLHVSQDPPRWAYRLKKTSDIIDINPNWFQFDDSRNSNWICEQLCKEKAWHEHSQLVRLMNWSGRRDLADDPDIPTEILQELSRDPLEDIRGAVARNPSIPTQLLSYLAKDTSKYVREMVAVNEKTSSEVLACLALDDKLSVRCAVISNPKSPPKALINAAGLSSAIYQTVPADNILEQQELVLNILINDKRKAVRSAASANPARGMHALTAAREILRKRMEDPDGGGSIFEGDWKLSPEDDQASMLGRKNSYSAEDSVAEHAEAYRSSPSDAVSEYSIKLVNTICRLPPRSAPRYILFMSKRCPVNILSKNLQSRCWIERFAIAGNPSTPEAVLERMANEGNQLVRRAARANLEARSAAQPGTDDQGGDQP